MTFTHVPNPAREMNEAEKSVFGRLVDQIEDPDVLVMSNVTWMGPQDEREFDFVISMPGVGVGLVEVKGGSVQVAGNRWRQWDVATRSMVDKNFAAQLDEERRALEGAFRVAFGRQWPKHSHVIVFPDARFDEAQHYPGMGPEIVVHRGNIETLFDRLRANVAGRGGCDYTKLHQLKLKNVLGAQQQESYEEDVVRGASARSGLVDRLSREQTITLDMLEDNPRVLVTGGPGTGKTILAIEEAVRLTERGGRVALLCYNRGLSAMLNDRVSTLAESSRPAVVGSLMPALQRVSGAPDPAAPSGPEATDYWERAYPDSIIAAFRYGPPENRFDAVIIDEQQDVKAHVWPVVEAALRDPDAGRIIMFGDAKQDIFQVAGEAPWPVARVKLRDNLRSSKSIATALNAFYGDSMRPAGLIAGSAPEVHIVPDGDDVFRAVDEYVDTLVDGYGWHPGHIVVLATHNKSENHLITQREGPDAYWQKYLAGDSVFHSHVSSFKGLERPMVIVAVNGFSQSATSDPLRSLYVACGRARDDLVIFGHAADIAALGDVRAHMAEVAEGV